MEEAVSDVDAVAVLCDRFKLAKQSRWCNTAVSLSHILSNFIVEYKNTKPKTSGKAVLRDYIQGRAPFFGI